MKYSVSQCGQDGLLISFRERISYSIHRKVLQQVEILEKLNLPGVDEIIPSYCSLLIRYDPLRIEPAAILQKMVPIKRRIFRKKEQKRILKIPVLYGGSYGMDLSEVARLCKIKEKEVIRLHTSIVFRVFAIGFLPGFPYLGIVPSRIALPRLESPRKRVEKGSVAIANRQTGIYPLESPGGWRILGRTPFELFSQQQEPPTLFRPGDQVRFQAISEEEFFALQAKVQQGDCLPFERNWGD